jgi:hypothetical protein
MVHATDTGRQSDTPSYRCRQPVITPEAIRLKILLHKAIPPILLAECTCSKFAVFPRKRRRGRSALIIERLVHHGVVLTLGVGSVVGLRGWRQELVPRVFSGVQKVRCWRRSG